MDASDERGHFGLPGVVRRDAERIDVGAPAGSRPDAVVEEEPLEIRVDDETVAVTMRTPGDDRDLALGFLFGEGIVRSIDDVGEVAHCGRRDREGFRNVLRVSSAPGTRLDADRVMEGRRWLPVSSACGVCGRRSIEELLERCGVVTGGAILSARAVERGLDEMRARQARFDRTGGIHAAAAFAAEGSLLAIREDVGRHNAVDKVVGALLQRGRLGDAALLTVSGRAGFEIVQKAAAAGIPVVASVSAASSLAIDLARDAGITLAAFARGGSMSVYAHPRRVVPLPLAGIFVGGRSSRMGRPKGLVELPGGETILGRTVALLERAGLRCVLVGDARAYRERFPTLAALDDEPGLEGPVAGLAALGAAAGDAPAIALACDMPFVDAALLERLIRFDAGCEAVAPREEDGRWQPFFARYDAARTLARIRATRPTRLQAIFEGPHARELPLDPRERRALQDWDTPADVAAGRGAW